MITFTDPAQLRADGVTPDKPYVYAAVEHGLCNDNFGLDFENAETQYANLAEAFNTFIGYVDRARFDWHEEQPHHKYAQDVSLGLDPFYEVGLTIFKRDEKNDTQQEEYSLSVRLTTPENYQDGRGGYVENIAIVDNNNPNQYEVMDVHHGLPDLIDQQASSISVSTLDSVNWCPQSVHIYAQILENLQAPHTRAVWEKYASIGAYKTALASVEARLQSEIHHQLLHNAPYSVIAKVLPCFENKTFYYTFSPLSASDSPATCNWHADEDCSSNRGLPVQTVTAMWNDYNKRTTTTPIQSHPSLGR